MSKLGTVVKIQHASNRGNFTKLVPSRARYARVVREYMDGDVMVENSQEVWQVRPSKDSKAQFETYVPVVDSAERS